MHLLADSPAVPTRHVLPDKQAAIAFRESSFDSPFTSVIFKNMSTAILIISFYYCLLVIVSGLIPR